MPNPFVKDKKKTKKKQSPLTKLWKNFVSIFGSKRFSHLTKSKFTLVSKNSSRLVTMSSSRHRHHHHHHYHTITNHNHYYYLPPPHQPDSEAEKGLVVANNAYDKPPSSEVHHHVDTSLCVETQVAQYDDKNGGREKEIMENSNSNSISNSNSDCIALSRQQQQQQQQQLLGIDAKAEEFIDRFKEVLRLERQKSLDEYWEMLARSA